MNISGIIFIGVFLGGIAAIYGTLFTYTKRKRSLSESQINITNMELELLETIRSIGIDKLQQTETGRELCSLLTEQDLQFIAVDVGNSSKFEHGNPMPIGIRSVYSLFGVLILGVLGGLVSIILPWLLFQWEYQWIFYMLLVFALVSGSINALLTDAYFRMDKAPMRFALALISGIMGGWLSPLIATVILLLFLGYTIGGEPRRVSLKIISWLPAPQSA